MTFSTKRVGDVIEEIAMGPFGSNIKVDCFVSSGVPVLNGSNLTGFSLTEETFNYVTFEKATSLKRAVASRGDIVITHRGTLGQIVYIPSDSKHEKYVISQSQFRVRCKESVMLPEFMVYFFHSREGKHQLLSNSSQVGVPALARPSSTFQELEMPVPTIIEQRVIVDTLSVLNARIAENRKINHHLEQMAATIWSERFGSCKPNGTLGDIIELFDFKRVPLSGNQREKMDKIYPYYGAASLMDYVDDYLFDGIYLLLGEDGTVIDDLGFPTLQYVWGKFWVNNHAHILQGRNGFTVESLYTLLRQTSVTSIVTGAVQPKINQANLKALSVIIPSEQEMKEFNNLIDPLFAQIRENRDANQRLVELRDTLLPRLMSGELSVADLCDAK